MGAPSWAAVIHACIFTVLQCTATHLDEFGEVHAAIGLVALNISTEVGFGNIRYGSCCASEADVTAFLSSCTEAFSPNNVQCSALRGWATNVVFLGNQSSIDALEDLVSSGGILPVIQVENLTYFTNASFLVVKKLALEFPNISYLFGNANSKSSFLKACSYAYGPMHAKCVSLSKSVSNSTIVNLKGRAGDINSIEDSVTAGISQPSIEVQGRIPYDTSGVSLVESTLRVQFPEINFNSCCSSTSTHNDFLDNCMATHEPKNARCEAVQEYLGYGGGVVVDFVGPVHDMAAMKQWLLGGESLPDIGSYSADKASIYLWKAVKCGLIDRDDLMGNVSFVDPRSTACGKEAVGQECHYLCRSGYKPSRKFVCEHINAYVGEWNYKDCDDCCEDVWMFSEIFGQCLGIFFLMLLCIMVLCVPACAADAGFPDDNPWLTLAHETMIRRAMAVRTEGFDAFKAAQESDMKSLNQIVLRIYLEAQVLKKREARRAGRISEDETLMIQKSKVVPVSHIETVLEREGTLYAKRRKEHVLAKKHLQDEQSEKLRQFMKGSKKPLCEKCSQGKFHNVMKTARAGLKKAAQIKAAQKRKPEKVAKKSTISHTVGAIISKAAASIEIELSPYQAIHIPMEWSHGSDTCAHDSFSKSEAPVFESKEEPETSDSDSDSDSSKEEEEDLMPAAKEEGESGCPHMTLEMLHTWVELYEEGIRDEARVPDELYDALYDNQHDFELREVTNPYYGQGSHRRWWTSVKYGSCCCCGKTHEDVDEKRLLDINAYGRKDGEMATCMDQCFCRTDNQRSNFYQRFWWNFTVCCCCDIGLLIVAFVIFLHSYHKYGSTPLKLISNVLDGSIDVYADWNSFDN